MSKEAKKLKKIPINISLHPEDKAEAERMAEEEDRSISYFIGSLIRKASEEDAHQRALNKD